MSRLFGYARVSTHKQCLDVQIDQLEKAGVRKDRICTDIGTGSNMKRTGLEELLIKVEHGDKVFVCKLDRLGRDTRDMLDLIDQFDKKGVIVRFLSDGIATDGPMGRMVIQILSAIAEAERNRILERSREGVAYAREKGVKFGRKPIVPVEEVIKRYKSGQRAVDIARALKIGRSTVYAVMKGKDIA